jgi:hypothetical protein
MRCEVKHPIKPENRVKWQVMTKIQVKINHLDESPSGLSQLLVKTEPKKKRAIGKKKFPPPPGTPVSLVCAVAPRERLRDGPASIWSRARPLAACGATRLG